MAVRVVRFPERPGVVEEEIAPADNLGGSESGAAALRNRWEVASKLPPSAGSPIRERTTRWTADWRGARGADRGVLTGSEQPKHTGPSTMAELSSETAPAALTREGGWERAERMGAEAVRQPDWIGRIVGLLVFSLGVVLLVIVFVSTSRLERLVPAPGQRLDQWAIQFGVKLASLFISGLIASMIAGRGAQLYAAANRAL